MTTDADKALMALGGWHAGHDVSKGIKHDECTFLYADGTLQAGGPPQRVWRVRASSDIVSAGGTEEIKTSIEYAVAWRHDQR